MLYCPFGRNVSATFANHDCEVGLIVEQLRYTRPH